MTDAAANQPALPGGDDEAVADALLPAVQPVADPPTPLLDADELDTARSYADAARAPSTRRAYAHDWQRFCAWCFTRGLDPLPADPRVVAVFLSAEADSGAAPPTIGRRLAAIGFFHRRAGLQPPQAREGAAALLDVLAGIRRSHGIAPTKKHAADADVLQEMLRAITGDDLRAVRDRALLAFGMAGAFRRSELVALRFQDVLAVPEGLRVTIRRSKTDQEGTGVTIAIPDGRYLRPHALLQTWLERAGIVDGFLFRRLAVGTLGAAGTIPAAGAVLTAGAVLAVSACPMSDRSVARLVQARAAAAGYDPDNFAGHSLRAGFLTAAARSGASIFKMREVSRHKSMQVLADYVRDAELFRDHAGEKFL